jgi:hypothetical protein
MYIKNNIPNAVIALYFDNSMSMRSFCDIQYFKKYFDYIYTSDFHDAEDYQFIFWPAVYSKPSLTNHIVKYDVTYCGAAKNRSEELLKVYNMLAKSDFKIKFTIVGIDNPPPGIGTTRIPYSQVLTDVLESKAVVEICNAQRCGTTLRACEAFTLNKYLITNNQAVLKSKYYNPRFVRVLDTSKPLSVDMFIPPKEPVDFAYDGGLSPVELLKDIIRRAEL